MSNESNVPHGAAGKAATILVVDDNANIRELVSSLLQREGYLVLEASGGAEALRLCTEHEGPLHLLLTDIQMPGMDGLALAAQALALRPGLSILYMSAQSRETFRIPPGNQRGRAFISKPFTPEALVQHVRDLLRSSE